MVVSRIGLVFSVLAFLGCKRDEPHPVIQTSSSAIPIAECIAPPPSAPPLKDARMPGPNRKRLLAAVSENATCEACHEEQTKQWRGSFHQRANTDPAYREAFAIEPSPFCRGCHAPEADPLQNPPESVSALGVGCVSCHLVEPGVILAALRPGSENAERAPHSIRRSADFSLTGACVGCHEFRFPMPGGDEDEFFMQTTIREHDRSPAKQTPCAECHMPLVQGRRSHSFANVRDEAYLRENLVVKAERSASNTLVLTLSQPNPGHDYPTGDLFRRLEVGYELKNAAGKLLKRETTHLARHFEHAPGKSGRTLTLDNRVQSEPHTIELTPPLPAAQGSEEAYVHWWVTYQRVATVGSGVDPADAKIESEVKLHSGKIPWYKPPSL